MQKKVLVAIGTRPEVIKLAPVIQALEKSPWSKTIVCVAAQHRQLVDLALGAFKFPVDHDLDIMQAKQTLADLCGRILHAFEKIIKQVSPDLVVVQGDTTTCFAASLASFYNHVPIAHVEAGLRTLNLQSPFPEEANRVLVSRLADFHFAPTERARENLHREGVDPSRIFVTGNTVVDALMMIQADVDRLSTKQLIDEFGDKLATHLLSLELPLVLITAHRRESFGEGLASIATAVRELAVRHSGWIFVFPLHANPNARQPPKNSLASLPNVFLLEPLKYVSFVWLLRRSSVILTDSGGLQEEATAIGKPLLIARNVTERTEALELGNARLVGTSTIRIVAGVEDAIRHPPSTSKLEARQAYGRGNAATRIVEALTLTFGCKTAPAGLTEFEVAG